MSVYFLLLFPHKLWDEKKKKASLPRYVFPAAPEAPSALRANVRLSATFCLDLRHKLSGEMARPNTNIERLSYMLWPLRKTFPAPFSSSETAVSGFLLPASLA